MTNSEDCQEKLKPEDKKRRPKKSKAKDENEEDTSIGVGSIAGGGRYDELVGMFSSSSKKVPCVGFSVGVERIFSILLSQNRKDLEFVKPNECQVFVMSVGDGLLEERMRLTRELWDAGIKVNYFSHLFRFSFLFFPSIPLHSPSFHPRFGES